jgi:hypothetical protein
MRYVYGPSKLDRLTDRYNKVLASVVHGGRVPKYTTDPPLGAVVTVLKAPKNPLGVGYVTVEDEFGIVYNAVLPQRLRQATNG